MTALEREAHELAEAVRSNDVEAVARLLTASPQLRSRLDDAMPGEPFGATPLLAAVYRDNRRMVEVLLEAGADINARSHWWAGSFGVLDHDGALADYLIARGATMTVHAAARLGRVEKLDELLDADPALVHARGGDGQTPLHFASSVEVARRLLDAGADVDARDIDHESTPAQWMVRDRQTVARYLVDRGCGTDLLMVSALGDESRVAALLSADPSSIRIAVTDRCFPKQDRRSGGSIYNWTLGSGKTAHIVAHDFGHAGVLRILMQYTPPTLAFAVACQLVDEDQVRSLLAGNPSLVQALGEEELRKLPDCVRDENVAAMRLMLSVGWPVDARGQHGGTALHWSAWHGATEVTREILQYEPPLEVTDHDYGGTPLSWAIYGSVHGWRCRTGDYAGTVELLLQAGARPPALADGLEASPAVREILLRAKE